MRAIPFCVALLFSLASCTNGGRNETATAPTEEASAGVPTPFPGAIRFSFVDRFRDGSINSNAPAATPTKRGALILRWPWGRTDAASLTVLAAYRYTYRDVAINSGDVLAFSAAKPFSIGGSDVRAFIDVRDRGHVHRVFAAALPPETSSAPQWKSYAIPLASYQGHRVQVTFGADSINGSGVAAWAAFANPAIYAPGHR